MPSRRKRKSPDAINLTWSEDTELIGLTLELQPLQDSSLYPQYTIGLHAWFLDQVRQADPDLSAYMHDGESEKPFTISGLQGLSFTSSRSHSLNANQTYRWTITALSQPVVQWLAQWLEHPPTEIDLRDAPLQIKAWTISHPATNYNNLFESSSEALSTAPPAITLSFLSPTSFRRKGHHFPLPVPRNVFHSYLRRWNDFSEQEFDQQYFLDWIEEYVILTRHHLQSTKVVAGKKGSVTGFTGSVEFGLLHPALEDAEFTQLFVALGQLAPYCGTGHKTTFGLGQTRIGWSTAAIETAAPAQDLLAQRIDELTELFKHQRKRTGGDRATHTAETWATVLARRELGESLQNIAQDLEIPYETAKTYSKLARRALKSE
ncbi:MAG: CRISPR-associated endoribonuclease Cas6 [Leptolyngbyaceae cyanobacterium RM2_2_4]|nr:CRISPR-associated endoribonuclease Cas6 [Leptolyngbyaceae cyanobacterium SL_5_14]NJO51098.1 CRISPR-associated endoribonuclease Cas6 [Leptolyngbyaceae cyanobacterium RM2_2_4]NJO75122.1 CRISPR-associated endoribonuclease Cas6 [Leptolyngbyaceae cyanobacterium RM1_406_9]